MQSLSEQLKLAASSDATRLARGASSAASFLYSPREAANFTLDQIFSVGSNGFHALVQQNTAIAPFADILLSDKSRRTDRSLLDKKQVQTLDASLDQILRLLSPYILLRPSAQALEWLIRRFRINEFNINAVFEMMLPFHETPQFAQMLQIIDLDKHAAFRQLQAVKKSMQPCPRHMLVSYMTRNTDLAMFVINTLPNAIVHGTVHRALIGFWTATLLDYINIRPEITASETSILLPAIFAAIKSRKNQETQLAAYVVLTALTNKTAFTSEAIESILTMIAVRRTQGADPDAHANDEAAITTMITICQRQDELDTLPPKCWKSLLAKSTSLDVIIRLASVYDISRFSRPLFRSLAAALSTDEKAGPTLLRFAKQQPNLPKPSMETCRNLTEAIYRQLTQQTKEEDHEEFSPDAIEILALIKQTHPQMLTNVPSPAEKGATAAEIAFAINEFQVRGTDAASHALLMGMHDPDATVRKDFYIRVLANPSAFEKGQLKLILDSLFEDDSPVVSGILPTIDLAKLQADDRPDDVLAASSRILAKETTARPIVLDHVRMLLKNSSSHDFALSSKVLLCMWSRLLYTKANRKTCVAIWQELAQSHLTSNGQILGGIQLSADGGEWFNWSMAQKIAQNILSSSRSEGFPSFLLVESEKPPASSAVLSLLVLLAMLKSESCPIAFVDSVLQDLRINHGQLVTAEIPYKLFEGDQPSGQLMNAVYTKSKSAKAAAALRLCVLASAVDAWTRNFGAIDVWSQLPNELATYAAQTVYATKQAEISRSLQASLSRNLEPAQYLSLSAKMWTGANTEAAITVKALLAACSAVKPGHDYQLYVALLFAPLSHHHPSVRDAALTLLQAFQTAATGSQPVLVTVPGLLTNIGQISTLSSKTASAYIGIMLRQSAAVAADADELRRIHCSLDARVSLQDVKKPRKFKQAIYDWIASLLSDFHFVDKAGVATLSSFASCQDSDLAIRMLPFATQLCFHLATLDATETAQASIHCFEASLRIATFLQEADMDKGRPQLDDLLKFLSDTARRHCPEHVAEIRKAVVLLFESLWSLLPASLQLEVLSALVVNSASGLDSLSVCASRSLATIQPNSQLLVSYIARIKQNLWTETHPSSKKQKLTDPASNMAEQALHQSQVLFENVSWDKIRPELSLLVSLTELQTALLTNHISHARFVPTSLALLSALKTLIDSMPDNTSDSTGLRLDTILEVLKLPGNNPLVDSALSILAKAARPFPDKVTQYILPLLTLFGSGVLQRDDDKSQRVVSQVMHATLPVVLSRAKESSQTHKEVENSLMSIICSFVDACAHVPRHRQAILLSDLARLLGPQEFLHIIIDKMVNRSPLRTFKSSTDVYDHLKPVFDSMSIRDQLASFVKLSLQIQNYGANQLAERLRLAQFLLAYLSDPRLGSRTDASRAANDVVYDQGLQDILKAVTISRAGQALHSSLEAVLANISYAVGRLLSLDAFSQATTWLFNSSDPVVHRFALRLVIQRIHKLDAARRLQCLPSLEAAYRCLLLQTAEVTVSDSIFEMSTSLVKHASVAEQIHVSALLDKCLLLAVQYDNMYNGNAMHAYEAVAALSRACGTRLLGKVDAIFSLANQICSSDTISESDKNKVTAALIESVLATVPTFISNKTQNMVSIVERIRSVEVQRQLISSLATRLPFTAMIKALHDDEDSVQTLSNCGIQLLRSGIVQASAQEITANQRKLMNCLLAAYGNADVHVLAVHEAYVAMTLKLNANAFRPLFLKTIDWAFSENGGERRAAVVFNIAKRLLVELEDIFLPYFGHLLDPIIAELELSLKQQNIRFQIWEPMLLCLTSALHIRTEFWSASRLERLVGPVLQQVELARIVNDRRLSTHLTPAIVSLAQAASANEQLLQLINSALLQKLQNDALKLVTIHTLCALWRDVGADMLSLVTSSIPFLLELLEDDAADVKTATRTLMQAIEEALGEPLDSYMS